MITTEVLRFVLAFLLLTEITICVLVVLNVYALEVFLMLIMIESLLLVELTKPSVITISWRKNTSILVIICIIVFAIILYQRVTTNLCQ